MTAAPARVLMVCLGNICRSPTAEVVLRHVAAEAGVALMVASAGTGAWHVGNGADPRAITHARRRGLDLRSHRARQVDRTDFDRFDLIYAMDRDNLRNLQRLQPTPSDQLQLFLGDDEVPDPWSGGPDGFEHVLDLVTARARLLVAAWQR
jgi:protein-tyrosine phosphatase